jgi:hypothetical protein
MGCAVAARTSHAGTAAVVLVAVLALAAAVAALVAAAGALVVWLGLRHPFCLAAVGLSAGALWGGGPVALVVVWSLVALVALAWCVRWPASFDRRVRRRWRRTFVYGWRWRQAMTACDLDRSGRWLRQVPRLGAVWSTRWADTVSVHPLDGQRAAWFAARSDELAWTLGARACAVRPEAPGVVRLELQRSEARGRLMTALHIPALSDLGGVRLGARHDGGGTVATVERSVVVVVLDSAGPQARHRRGHGGT